MDSLWMVLIFLYEIFVVLGLAAFMTFAWWLIGEFFGERK
jgi:hypothetical protein